VNFFNSLAEFSLKEVNYSAFNQQVTYSAGIWEAVISEAIL
jgi:hypothetical protein